MARHRPLGGRGCGFESLLRYDPCRLAVTAEAIGRKMDGTAGVFVVVGIRQGGALVGN